MRNHIHQNTPPRVPDSTRERARQGQCDVPSGLLAALLCATGLADATDAQAVGETTRVSVNSAGAAADFQTINPAISANGRFVVFASWASNLVPNDTNERIDAFVHDRTTSRTTRVSVNSSGDEGDGGDDYYYQINTAISGDGRIVAFSSLATNLVVTDTNGSADVFVHDRLTHLTTRVSTDSLGNQANASSGSGYSNLALSASGRFVAFGSDATNLVAGDTNDAADIFVHDQQTHQTTLVSINSAGIQGNGRSSRPKLSADGRFVVFSSTADNLVAGDTNAQGDIFLHDRTTHQTTRVSLSTEGTQGNGWSDNANLSAAGRFVAFASESDNLVAGDTNNRSDIFVHDRQTKQTSRVSIDSKGNQAVGWYRFEPSVPAMSSDGRFVTFSSDATNLAPNNANSNLHVFVHDRQTHDTEHLSVDSAGNQGNGESFLPAISSDGRYVAFASYARLVPGGTGWLDIYLRDRLLDRSATADLGITQTADPARFTPLSPLTYTLTAVNHGPDAATEVTVNDRPALLSGTVVSVVPSQGACSQGAPFVCYLGTLAPGASSTIT